MADWYFKILPGLPKPPAELVIRIDRSYRPANEQFAPDNAEYLGIKETSDWRKQPYDWIQPMTSNNNVRQHFDGEFTDWIRNNITPEFQFGNSGVMFFNEPQLPHTDTTRDFVLLYNVDCGGADTSLCFWQERGQPLRRERMLAVERGPHLELLESIKGPFETWYLMNARVVHSVENMTGMRVNLQVSFDAKIPEVFASRHLS
jgi:hypothetical protein